MLYGNKITFICRLFFLIIQIHYLFCLLQVPAFIRFVLNFSLICFFLLFCQFCPMNFEPIWFFTLWVMICSCLVSFSSFLLYSFHAFLLDFCQELEIYFDTFCSSNFVIICLLYFCGKPYMSFLGTCLYSALPMEGASVPPLVRELRFYIPHGMAK